MPVGSASAWSEPGDPLLPEVIAARCVHSLMEQATCRACVDACPTRAWVIDDERLGIDPGRCDGCGLCAPACPEGAILGHHAPALVQGDGLPTAFAVCGRASTEAVGAVEGTKGLLPCLHVLGVRALVELWHRGIRRLVLCAGDCGTCPRGGAVPLEHALRQLSALLLDRGEKPVEAYTLPPERWLLAWRDARARQRAPAQDRRAFFRGLVAAAAETAASLAQRADPRVADFIPPGRMIPGTPIGGLRLHAPRIDGARCTGCDACARLCPHAAIRSETRAYLFDPDGCTGCGICVDACVTGALSIQPQDPSPPTRLPLHERRCHGCGAPFRTPEASIESTDLCPICTVTGHHGRLYQVLA